MDAREVLTKATRSYLRYRTYEEVNDYEFAGHLLDALSAAGMTICGEQVGEVVGWDDAMDLALARIDKPVDLFTALFVPLSDPQEGDK